MSENFHGLSKKTGSAFWFYLLSLLAGIGQLLLGLDYVTFSEYIDVFPYAHYVLVMTAISLIITILAIFGVWPNIRLLIGMLSVGGGVSIEIYELSSNGSITNAFFVALFLMVGFALDFIGSKRRLG